MISDVAVESSFNRQGVLPITAELLNSNDDVGGNAFSLAGYGTPQNYPDWETQL